MQSLGAHAQSTCRHAMPLDAHFTVDKQDAMGAQTDTCPRDRTMSQAKRLIFRLMTSGGQRGLKADNVRDFKTHVIQGLNL